MENYKVCIPNVKNLIKQADYILIGAGAGLSTAAGLEYSGRSFENNFEEFINKYHFQDLYSATFYDFNTSEEKWAFWAKLIKLNRFNREPLTLYKELFELVKNKEHFVITTNVDGQFEKAGFEKDKIFAVQGDYAYLQCEEGCHNRLYYNEELVNQWLKNMKDCKISSDTVPKCPVCGKDMDMNLRKDANFVQDENWYKQSKKYEEFLEKVKEKKVVLLELGVGFNTPGIIRLPFEQMTYQNNDWNLIRFNKENCQTFFDIDEKIIKIQEDINIVIPEMRRD